jgi:hypothetical protein
MKNNLKIILILLSFQLAWNLNSYGQEFEVQFKGKHLKIDSIIIFDSLGIKFGTYHLIPKSDLLKQNYLTLIYVKKNKICMPIDFNEIYCDTIVVKLNIVILSDQLLGIIKHVAHRLLQKVFIQMNHLVAKGHIRKTELLKIKSTN